MTEFEAQCRENKLKVTPQRAMIFRELMKSKNHPNAEVMYEKVRRRYPRISFDTVYRTLLTFAEIGLVRLVEGYGEPKRFDPDLSNHHHLRCLKCNSITDFQEKSFDNLKIPSKLKKNFVILNQRIVLEGVCEKCQKK